MRPIFWNKGLNGWLVCRRMLLIILKLVRSETQEGGSEGGLLFQSYVTGTVQYPILSP